MCSSDLFIFRNFWVSLKTNAELLTGKNYSNGVYKGKSGYLIEDAATPDPTLIDKNISYINTLAENTSLNVSMMLIPNASNILKDHLPALAPVRNQASDLDDVISKLSGNVNYTDVSETLSSHPEEQLYYKTDHHWTTLAAYYSFLEFAPSIGIDPSTISYDTYTVSDNFSGTLASTSGYWFTKKDTIQIYVPNNSDVDYVVEYAQEKEKTATVYNKEKLSGTDQYALYFGGNHPLIEISTTNLDGIKLMVVKDSYANCFIPFLIPYCSDIIIVDPRYYYDNIEQKISDSGVTDVLFLYNANTFFEDNSLQNVFEE